MTKRLDPYRDLHSVGPVVDPNCLKRLSAYDKILRKLAKHLTIQLTELIKKRTFKFEQILHRNFCLYFHTIFLKIKLNLGTIILDFPLVLKFTSKQRLITSYPSQNKMTKRFKKVAYSYQLN